MNVVKFRVKSDFLKNKGQGLNNYSKLKRHLNTQYYKLQYNSQHLHISRLRGRNKQPNLYTKVNK